MTPTTPNILGYTAVSGETKEIVNQNKILEEVIMQRIEAIERLEGVDRRSLSIAKTHIQGAFMWFNRGIFNPSRINLSGE